MAEGASAELGAIRRRAIGALIVAVVLHTALVATHRGEFWPCSIYPMFSTAGRPWTRALVRDVTALADARIDGLEGLEPRPAWAGRFEAPPGQAFALADYGIPHGDLSVLLAKTERWDGLARAALAGLFAGAPAARRLLVLQATGRWRPDRGEVALEYQSVALLEGGQIRWLAGLDPDEPILAQVDPEDDLADDLGGDDLGDEFQLVPEPPEPT